MCSISVDPRPSRISTPKRSVHRLPISAGSASPADAQMRSVELAALRQLRAREQRREERRHAVEDRRPMADESRDDRSRRRALGHQDRRGADRHRKRQRIAEAVGEEELGRREHDVVLANAEHRFRVELRRLDQARMRVHRALGRAGGSRRIEPEAGVVRTSFRPARTWATPGRHERGERLRRIRVLGARVAGTITWRKLRVPRRATGAIVGRSCAETTSARARLSCSM